MISQQDIDRGIVVTVEGRKFLHITNHVRWRQVQRPVSPFISSVPIPMTEYWAPISQRWVIAGESPSVGDIVCFRRTWPFPLFSQRGTVMAIHPQSRRVDVNFPTGKQLGIDTKTLCIV